MHRSVSCITRGTWLSLWESCRRSRLRGKNMTIFLTALGLEVLRFSNRDVDMDFRGVCTQIDITIQKRL